MRRVLRPPLPFVLPLASPFLAAAITLAVAVIDRGLPPVTFVNLARDMDLRVVWLNAFIAFAGAIAGGLMTRGGPL